MDSQKKKRILSFHGKFGPEPPLTEVSIRAIATLRYDDREDTMTLK